MLAEAMPMVENAMEVPDMPELDALCADEDVLATLTDTLLGEGGGLDVFEPLQLPTACDAARPDSPPAGEAPARAGSSDRRKRRASSLVEEDFNELLRAATSGPRRSLSDVESVFAGHGHGLDAGPATDLVLERTSPHRVPEITTKHTSLVVPKLEQLRGRGRAGVDSPDSDAADSPESVSSSMSSSMSSRGSPSPSRASMSPNGTRKRRNCGASTNPELAAQRNHVCELCQSRFLCKSKLDRHMRTHTGDKPFSCYCGKSFNQKSALKNHSRRHIKRRDVPKDVDYVARGLNGFSYFSLMGKQQ